MSWPCTGLVVGVVVVVSVVVRVVVVVGELVWEDVMLVVRVVVRDVEAVVVAEVVAEVVGVDRAHPVRVPSRCEPITRLRRWAAVKHAVPNRASTAPLMEHASCTPLPPGYAAMILLAARANDLHRSGLDSSVLVHCSVDELPLPAVSHARATFSNTSACGRQTSSDSKRNVWAPLKHVTLP